MTTTRPLWVYRLGVIDYARGLEWQRAGLEAVRGGAPERLALLEHAPVYTLGARAARTALRVSEGELPAPLVEADRGGDVTFHGPGQLVAYPVLDLRTRGLRPGDYVRTLEEVVLRTMATLGVQGERWPGRPGAWVRVDGALAKVAAIGVRVRGGVTQHGLALNVATDLRWYGPIVACGIEDAGVTSLDHLLGRAASMGEIEDALLDAFASILACAPVDVREPLPELARA